MILVLIALLQFQAQAEPANYHQTELQCGLQNFSHFYHNFLGSRGYFIQGFKRGETGCEDAQRVDFIVSDVKRMFSNFHHEKKALFMVEITPNPFSDKFGMHLPLETKLGKIQPVHIIHEYGHQIFDVNLGKFSKLQPFSAVKYKTEEELSLDVDFAYQEGEKAGNFDLLSDKLEAAQVDHHLIGKNFDQNFELARRNLIFIAYSELFADLIAVLYYQNPKVITESMPEFYQTKLKDDVPFRSQLPAFEKAYQKNIIRRNFCETASLNDIDTNDLHNITQPIKFELCKKFFSKGTFEIFIASKVLTAEIEAMTSLFENTDVSIQNDDRDRESRSVKLLNTIMIKKIEKF